MELLLPLLALSFHSFASLVFCRRRGASPWLKQKARDEREQRVLQQSVIQGGSQLRCLLIDEFLPMHVPRVSSPALDSRQAPVGEGMRQGSISHGHNLDGMRIRGNNNKGKKGREL